tara:strand:- start:20603 stop:20890 length:288 start_codon:yes stop_codon:yes gene_type:complete
MVIMAVDTKAKRFAIMTLMRPFTTPMPDTDGSFGKTDRLHFLGLYSSVIPSRYVAKITFQSEAITRAGLTVESVVKCGLSSESITRAGLFNEAVN